MRKFDLGNGHTITVENGNRGFSDDYKVTFYEDGKTFGSPEYMTKDCIEFEYDIVF